jgi:hypothetical protein
MVVSEVSSTARSLSRAAPVAACMGVSPPARRSSAHATRMMESFTMMPASPKSPTSDSMVRSMPMTPGPWP